VTNAATISTFGILSNGVAAQSIGGGGGNGGFAISGSLSLGGNATSNTTGGNGGAGETAGTVQVINTGAIHVYGTGAVGILAQSVGAGGGGGGAGTVSVDNFNTIITNGVNSTGILAQSVGGGGGSGGFAGGLTFSSSGEAQNTVGGGSGGAGNTPNSVTVTNETGAGILTNAANSTGILAQAIGGGGGSGGFSISGAASTGANGLAQSVGGQGGTGGNISDNVVVTVNNNGLIITNGSLSYGIYAQSVGGGGGVGAFSVAGAYSSSGGATSSVGGAGGAGGAGGVVVVDNAGSIIVNGTGSVGIYAQSVGGGGGSAGFSGALNIASGAFTSTVGGSGGAGGNGNTFTVINTGTIMTSQSNSVGIVAQSIGGGGGSAGFAGQVSFGGGALNNQVGGTGGNGGNGGNVSVTSTGSIVTNGNNSIAVLAQSIGGGGGSGAITFTGSTDGSISGTSLDVGGFNSSGVASSTGTVTVNVSGGVVQTGGALSYGLLAQAIGAGGGNAGLVIPDAVTIGGDPTIRVGGAGGVSGDGSPMNITNANVVTTIGQAAVGQVVQSIGGGGGTDGMAGNIVATGQPFNNFVGGTNSMGSFSGSGGAVQFQNSATISTAGDNALGVLVQSIGGGGGLGTYTYSTVTGIGNNIDEVVGGSQGHG
jgi:hypothetical protein